MTTRSSLGIIWTARSVAGVHQAAVPGIIFYGYFPERALPEVNGGDICRIWPSGAVQSVVRHWREHHVVSLELRIFSWPESSEWASVVERSLRWFIEAGAVVSWCGDETSIPSYPFDQTQAIQIG